MKEATGAKLALHREDLFLWDMLEDQCRMFGIPFEPPPPPDQWLENEEEIDLNDLQGKALRHVQDILLVQCVFCLKVKNY